MQAIRTILVVMTPSQPEELDSGQSERQADIGYS